MEPVGRAPSLIVPSWMEDESEVFIVLFAWEDDDGDTIHLGNWEAAFHAIWGDLERRPDIVVALAKQIVLEIVAYSFVYDCKSGDI